MEWEDQARLKIGLKFGAFTWDAYFCRTNKITKTQYEKRNMRKVWRKVLNNASSTPLPHFFDIYQQSSSNLLRWKYSELLAGTINLPATPDSARLRVSTQIVEAVDATGTLRLPGALASSEFPVLRLKKTTYRSQAIDVKVAPLGWLDVSTLGIQREHGGNEPVGGDPVTDKIDIEP